MRQTLSEASLDTMSCTSDNNTETAAFSSTPTTSHSSPEPYPQETSKGMSSETLSKGSSTVVDEVRHNYQDVSPDLLQNGFYNSQSLKDHASTIRKSLVMSDSMASVAIHDYDHGRVEKTGLAMTNSPSFSALASILEKKQVKGVKPKTVLSPNLIELDEDEEVNDASTSTIKPQEPMNDDNDIFKTPEVKQQRAFPLQPLTEALPRVDEAQEEGRGDVEDDFPNLKVLSTSPEKPSMDKELPSLQRPAMIGSNDPTSLPATHGEHRSEHHSEHHTINNYKLRGASQRVVPDHEPKSISKQTPVIGQHYSKRASSMPVLVDSQTHNKSQEKKRSFLSFFKKRSVSGTGVPQVNKQQQQQQQPKVKKMASSQSFQSQISQAQAHQPRAAQRSTSSNSVFSAFRRSKKPTFEIVEEPQFVYKQQEETHGCVNDDVFTNEPSDDNASFSSDEGFNEDFNKLKFEAMDESALQPSSNVEVEQEYETKRSSQISQGETLFPRKLSAHDVESIVSLERNRSQSRHSIISRRHSQCSNRPLSLVEAIESNAKEAGMYVEQGILRPPSTHSLSTSVQQSPKILDAQEGYNYHDDDDDDDSFQFEDFSKALEFDDIADQYVADNNVNNGNESPYDDNDVSDLLEFSEFIDFGGDLQLNFDLDDDSTPLSQPPLNFNPPSAISPDVRPFQSPVSLQSARFSNKGTQSPNTSPFIPDSAFVPSMSRPISMSFRGLKAPTLNRCQDSGSTHSFASSNAPSVNKGSKTVEFSSKITLYDVYAEDEYDRKPDIATCNQLTPQLAQRIRVELNELKSEMEVHEDSRCYTHFF